MPDKDFALSGRRFPIAGPPGSSRERDKWQAMQAVRYLNMGRVATKQDYLNVRNAIIRRYGMGFWRGYDGPTWPKIQKAKRRAGATRRRTSRRPSRRRRRLAANRSKEADREIKALAGLKMAGQTADYKELVRLLRKKYTTPYVNGLEVHARQEILRLRRRKRA
jgi:hypothetical protein